MIKSFKHLLDAHDILTSDFIDFKMLHVDVKIGSYSCGLQFHVQLPAMSLPSTLPGPPPPK